ncbi:MAG: OmpA family protein [Saprospiraceae bacterium]
MMRKISTLLFFFACSASVVFAQPITTATVEKMIEVAEDNLAKYDYYNALDWFEKAYKEERDTEVAYKIANLHVQLRDYVKAERWYSRIVDRKYRKKKNPYLPNARFVLGRLLKMNGKYIEAKEQLQLFIAEAEDPNLLTLAKNELTGADLAMDMEEQNPSLTVGNAGKKLNSKYSEYSPVLVSEKEVYFTAIRQNEILVLDGKTADYHSKVYKASKGEKDWSEPVALGTEINREGYHIGNIAISPNGNRMYFTRALLKGNKLSESKIYMSERSGGAWGAAKLLSGINGEYLCKQPTVGEFYGQEVLFFVSDMKGGYGGFDIYYAPNKNDGTFGDPVNLGTTLNTVGDEETPFYREGMLYFSSTGHPGIGGFDIFSSEWNGSNWSTPLNLGKGYNTSVDDLYFSLDAEGYNGFLVSNRPGTNSIKSKTCCNDIYTVELERMVLDLNALTFSEGKALPGATVQLIEMVNNSMGNTEDKSNLSANNFNFILEPEMAYMVIASRDGYFSDSLQFNTVGMEMSKTFDKRLDLKPVPPPPPPPPEDIWETYTINNPIELNNIYYDLNDDKILTEAEQDLEVIFELMNKYPDMIIELSSHTDSQGGDPYNLRLSQRRANSAKQWLVERGIIDSRVNAVGYGETRLRNKCLNGVKCSDDEHRFNRRTEFTIIAGPKSIQIEKKRLKKRN